MVIIGIDEVGRGCWAGPLVAGATVLPVGGDALKVPGLTLRDSKKLSKHQRQSADNWIRNNAIAIGLGWVWPAEIDRWGVTESVRVAFSRALEQMPTTYDQLILDGNINYFPDNPKSAAIVKADDSVPCVSAASIVAKVARDTYMATLDAKYDCYGFACHVGYGTVAHIEALHKYGVSDLHRLSYKPIKALLTL
jgi:ribonuclease HII